MKEETYNFGGIEYIEPTVTLLSITPIGLPELATRCCYSSHSGSENEVIREIGEGIVSETISDDLHDAEASKLVEKIVHTNMHSSVIEHVNMSFLVQNINRAVLQELARHRIGVSLSVQSTRYTVNDIIKLFFVALYNNNHSEAYFIKEVRKLNLFNIVDSELEYTKLASIYNQLLTLYNRDKDCFNRAVLSKQAIGIVNNSTKYKNIDEFRLDLFQAKNKRNAGDTVKAVIIDEMFNTSLVLSMNLRSLKHFLKLRDSGAAWEPMRQFAKQIRDAVPAEYLPYIERRQYV